MNPAWADLATEARIVSAVTIWSALAAFLAVIVTLVALWALVQQWRGRRRRGVPASLEEMPGHPERIRLLDDPVQDEIFGDIAEQLLDEGIADLAEKAGWFQ